MKKIILNIATSLDGYIEGPNGEFDWCFTDQDYGMEKFMKEIDTIFYGRGSYELFEKMGQPMYGGYDNYVFSTTLESAKDVILIADNLVEKVNEIKAQGGKHVWLFGGTGLVTSFLKHNLIDEMRIAVHPLILGGGKHLFAELPHRIYFEAREPIAYASGLVQLIYTKK